MNAALVLELHIDVEVALKICFGPAASTSLPEGMRLMPYAGMGLR